MARKSPKDSAKVRAAIKESEEEILKRVRREAMEGIRRLNKPSGYAPYELWPGESMDLGGFTVAKRKQKRKDGFA